jgi:alpha-beta hydrolase superfamily lysophospholipase
MVIVNHHEGYFQGVRDAQIYYQAWLPHRDPVAALLIVHGLAEHGGRYAHVASHMASLGYAIYAPDLIGHGRSEGARAYVSRFAEFTDMVARMVERVLTEQPGKPIYLLGHSLGATIGACCFLDHPSGLAGGVLSGVSVRMPDNVTPLTILLARGLSALAPRMPIQGIEAQHLSRDPAVVQAYVNDPLVYTGRICARTGIELLKAQRRILTEAFRVKLPVLMVHGSDDLLCPLAGARPFYRAIASEDKKLQVYEGLYHEVYNEPERELVLNDVAAWLEARRGST